MKDILLVTPPFTQLNTPYPATPYLKGFFNTKGISTYQMDLGIEVILHLYSRETFIQIFDNAYEDDTISSDNAFRIYALREEYLRCIDDVVLFLQGKHQTLARQICTGNFLPEASRFAQLDDMEWAFGQMGMQDKAKHLSTLFLEDLSDFIVECVDPHFGFSRYAERLGISANSFDELYNSLQEEYTPIDHITLQLLDDTLKDVSPKLVCISVPFPGNLYSAFRCAQYIKANYQGIAVSMGGGFPNTELRSLSDVRVFEFFDFITLDDGELPLELLHKHITSEEENDSPTLKRTFILQNDEVIFYDDTSLNDYPMREVGTPDYSDLLLDKYISVIEMANPMHSLWSDGRWNKLTMAHGCYWAKCTFCDVTLDYIGRFEPLAASLIVDRMEQLIAQTNERGFHFVDEAAPPSLMKALAIEILKRQLTVTWWTNVRFEKSFTPDFCQLLAVSGCIAVSGGLEIASDRLLKLIKKGVDVAQVAQVTRNFTESGIMVHAYLMYGFATQTNHDAIDSLEMVRQLFECGVIQSGFWHQFALTTHSPVGKDTSAYGLEPHYEDISFADNDVQFSDKTKIDHAQFSFGLRKSLFNYMHGVGFELPLQDWFDFKVPHTTIDPNFIYNSLTLPSDKMVKPKSTILWLGYEPYAELIVKKKKGQTREFLILQFNSKVDAFELQVDRDHGEWLVDTLRSLKPSATKVWTWAQLKEDFELSFPDFELFWYSKPMMQLRENGLVVV